jgi:pyruvate dehydrogenase E2 component (dihydrolipoamide acetyltransferase)
MAEFRMPSLGADMDAGTLIEWRVKPGDRVQRGDIVAVVDTDKAAVEVEVYESGIVERLLVDPGAKVPVGTPLAIIAGARADRHAGSRPQVPAREPGSDVPPPPAAIAPAPPAVAQEVARRASPAARKLALERGVDLTGITGTGPGGAITLADVEAAGRSPTAPDAAVRMRHAIAAAMTRAKREIPHYYLASSIAFARAADWLAVENAKRPVTARLLPAALLIKATALAARAFPDMNGFFVDGHHRASDRVHVGTATMLRGGGLLAPAICDADAMPLDDLMRALRDVVERARAGRLRSSEMNVATITVTNLGERGVDAVFGIIHPPQVALVGFGAVGPRPTVVDGAVVAAPTVHASLAADHRVSDGHRGALVLTTIADLLQEPQKL